LNKKVVNNKLCDSKYAMSNKQGERLKTHQTAAVVINNVD